MKGYNLNKANYIKCNENLNIIKIYDIKNLESYKIHIEQLIEWFNGEYVWDKMFNINDVFDRINNGHILFLLFYNNTAVGYVFFKPLNSVDCFGYNLYVTKKIDRPKNLAELFYNKVSGIILSDYENIKVEVEDWNSVVFKIIENIGYQKNI